MGLPYDIKVIFVDEDTSDEVFWIEGLPGRLSKNDVVFLSDVEYKVISVSLYLGRTTFTPEQGGSSSPVTQSEYRIVVKEQ